MQSPGASSQLLSVAERALAHSDAVLHAWTDSILAFDEAVERCDVAGLHDAAIAALAPCVRAFTAAQAAEGRVAAVRLEGSALRAELARLGGDVGAQAAALAAHDAAWDAAGDIDVRHAQVRRRGVPGMLCRPVPLRSGTVCATD